MDAWFWWVIAGAALAIAEIFTGTFVLLMFAAGTLAAAGAAGLGAPYAVQGIVFAVVSLLALAGVRPSITRHLHRAAEHADMGLDAIEGSEGLVLERVDSDRGLVKIGGEMWSARSYDATQVFEPGTRVRVIEVKGATALVWRE